MTRETGFGVEQRRRRANAWARRMALLAFSVVVAVTGCGGRRAAKAVTPAIGVEQKGIASWYGLPYHGRRTASGEVYDMERMTAAHRRWAFGTWVRVRNLDNGEETVVRINDRGPFVRGRIIDLSRAAARDVELIGPGIARVKLTVIEAPAHPPDSPAAKQTRGSARSRNTPPTGARWGVQVGSFRDKAGAEQLRLALARGNRAVNIFLGGNGYWRVVIGAFPQAAEAERLRAEIRDAYPDAFVVRFDDIT